MTTTDKIVQFPGTARPTLPGRLLIPERLTEARLASRLTQTELAEKIGVSRQAVSSYESGDKKPDPTVMEAIIHELQLPYAFFTKDNRIDFGIHSAIFFRKVGADTKRRNRACEIYARWASSIAYAFDEYVNYPAVDIPFFEPLGEAYTDNEIEQHAQTVREHFGLGLGPITNVIRLLETKGVIVTRYTVENENVEAFSFWSGARPFIFLASEKKSAARARFDVAHELAHLCLHKWVGAEEIEDKDRLKRIEREADKFASAFLLPRQSFPNEVYSSRLDGFVNLKARWKVSIQAMIYRSKDLGLFDDRQVTNLYKQISFKKWRTTEPLDIGSNAIPFEEPLLLKKIAELVFESGRYSKHQFKADVALSNADMQKIIGIQFPPTDEKIIPSFNPTLK
ncbi:helix-turn-helix domain-containing protein [Pseudochrobactrum sp. HB0163]|uniref:helix-turn-helix domain-containing protein n=1 Tax=Pseudochrobactrum sp. HB0163 TaxID=3450708 RepID=UPI003F6DC3F9